MTGRRFEAEKESTNERVRSVCTGLADLGVYSPPPFPSDPLPDSIGGKYIRVRQKEI